jgi:hypothetical protein
MGTDEKLCMDNLTDLLLLYRVERYTYSADSRTMSGPRQEYRNTEINNPREFKLWDIIFTTACKSKAKYPQERGSEVGIHQKRAIQDN